MTMSVRCAMVILSLSSLLTAQARDTLFIPASEPDYGIEHTNILKLHGGYGRQLDTYMSPMTYTGWQAGIGNEWWQGFRQDTRLGRQGKLRHWGHVGRVEVSVFRYLSPAYTNLFQGLQVAAGWGAFYDWRWCDERLKVHVGPYIEGNLGARMHGNNVNKPLSFDIGIDLMAMGGVSWSFYGKKTSYRLNYLIRTNLVGFDYLPDYWQSYYEIASGVKGQARCSGHWNHHALKHELSLDLQFPHSTWRIGAQHELLDYGTANLHFSRQQVGVVIGCIWKYKMKANARL